MLKLQNIAVLIAIEETGSIRAAAKRLGRTQPAVTKALKQAEADIGAMVFKRSPTGVVITEEGKAILRRASIIHAEVKKLHDEVEYIRGGSGGSINLTVSPLAAIKFVPPAFKRFRRRYPDTHVQISSGHEPMAFAPLRDGKVDIVIGPAPVGKTASGLMVEPLTTTPVIIIAGKGSRFADARSLHDLKDAEWLMIGTRERMPMSQQAFVDEGLRPPKPAAHSDSMFSVLSIVQDSDYLCTISADVMEDIRNRWQVVQVPVRQSLPFAQIAVTIASDRPLTPAARHFCDCVHQVAGS